MTPLGNGAADLLTAERFLRFGGLEAGPEYDTLTLWVVSAEIAEDEEGDGSGNPLFDRIIGTPKMIETGPGSLRYCIIFRDCLSYAWRDESYALEEDAFEESEDREDAGAPPLLRRHDRSDFLEQVTRRTGAADVLDVPVMHFAVSTLDAVIDVACLGLPEVTAEMLGPDDPGPKPGRRVRRD
ncbi:hypothetical protein [Mangrovicoccus algicola]|uniref:Uncharacterized protein n=1 Tax=Mangrovicoccus algicola TaxID=2771008 RepID=A0A8J7CIW2_9RHOB|nr:hypothetical protein [Mangrovicoccus algicola]MBE3640080.1 hypothetical protein [Mangrovicoccus algicola]